MRYCSSLAALETVWPDRNPLPVLMLAGSFSARIPGTDNYNFQKSSILVTTAHHHLYPVLHLPQLVHRMHNFLLLFLFGFLFRYNYINPLFSDPFILPSLRRQVCFVVFSSSFSFFLCGAWITIHSPHAVHIPVGGCHTQQTYTEKTCSATIRIVF